MLETTSKPHIGKIIKYSCQSMPFSFIKRRFHLLLLPFNGTIIKYLIFIKCHY